MLLNHLEIWKMSCLPLRELQVNLLKLLLVVYTACCCVFCLVFLTCFWVYLPAGLTEYLWFSSPPAFPSCGSRSPRHGYHTGQEQRGQYPLFVAVCVWWVRSVRRCPLFLTVPVRSVVQLANPSFDMWGHVLCLQLLCVQHIVKTPCLHFVRAFHNPDIRLMRLFL